MRKQISDLKTQLNQSILDKKTMEDGLGTDGWTGALVRALAGRFRNLLAAAASGIAFAVGLFKVEGACKFVRACTQNL